MFQGLSSVATGYAQISARLRTDGGKRKRLARRWRRRRTRCCGWWRV